MIVVSAIYGMEFIFTILLDNEYVNCVSYESTEESGIVIWRSKNMLNKFGSAGLMSNAKVDELAEFSDEK